MTLARRKDHPRAIIPPLARAARAMVCVVATPSSTRASSPVQQPPLDLGQTSFLDGEAGRGGLFEVIGNGYVAPQFTDASGGQVAGTNRQLIGTLILHLAYVSSVPVAGGSLGAETLIPVSTLHLEVPGTPEATQGGLGDVTIAPFIQWTRCRSGNGPYRSGWLSRPRGQYSPNDPINVGANAWQVSPYLAFTWRVSDRWEISRPAASLDAANSQTGGQFARNLSVSAAITDNWRLGVASYGLWQLDDMRVNGRAVPGSRQHVIAAGPGQLWSDGHATVIANVFEEIEAHNRPRGTSPVLRLLRPF